jgi:hypothetical protein
VPTAATFLSAELESIPVGEATLRKFSKYAELVKGRSVGYVFLLEEPKSNTCTASSIIDHRYWKECRMVQPIQCMYLLYQMFWIGRILVA